MISLTSPTTLDSALSPPEGGLAGGLASVSALVRVVRNTIRVRRAAPNGRGGGGGLGAGAVEGRGQVRGVGAGVVEEDGGELARGQRVEGRRVAGVVADVGGAAGGGVGVVAERFGRASGFRTPKVESTGSGGGFKLFCEGVGSDYPDISNSSRPIMDSEFRNCVDNGVGDVIGLHHSPITDFAIGKGPGDRAHDDGSAIEEGLHVRARGRVRPHPVMHRRFFLIMAGFPHFGFTIHPQWIFAV